MNHKAYDCLKTVLRDFIIRSFTRQKALKMDTACKIMDYNFSRSCDADKTAMDEAIAAGASREEELKNIYPKNFLKVGIKNFTRHFQVQSK